MYTVLHFKSLNSTNSYAKARAADIADRTVVSADTQTAGRGRMTRIWKSEEGGLYFSLFLKPSCTDHLANVTQLMALCVCQVLRAYGAETTLKWPNDVLCQKEKICGILSEVILRNNKIHALVVGVGINVSQQDLSDVGQPATSLVQQGINVNKQELLQVILNRFFEKYDRLLTDGFSSIRKEYISHFPYIEKQVNIQNGSSHTQGIVKGFSNEGELLLESRGSLHNILIGDMRI